MISHSPDGRTCMADLRCESCIKTQANTYRYRYSHSYHFHGDLTWLQKETGADEKPKTSDLLTCCVAEGD